MVIGFGDKVYQKYNYLYNIIVGLFLLVCSVVILVFSWNTIFSNEVIDLSSYLTESENEMDHLIHKKASVKINNCFGMFYHEVKAKSSDTDYYVIELEDGSLMAIMTDPEKGDLFAAGTVYEQTGYILRLNDTANEELNKYILHLQEDDIVKDDVIVREIVLSDEDEKFWAIVCLIIGFVGGSVLLILGISRYKSVSYEE